MIKLLSFFSGIGAFEKALSNLNIDFEVVNYCEIDKWASKSYCLIHNEDESKNLWDITKVNERELPDFDLLTYGFPCQPFSLAGKRLGKEDEKKGNLFFEALRIIKYKKPKYMIAENVKGLLSIHKGIFFKDILFKLQGAGYNNYYKVLNAKDYGISQNRERVFIVSIRKDIDDFNFEFPFKLKKCFIKKLLNYVDFDYLEENEFSTRVRKYYNYSPCLRHKKMALFFVKEKIKEKLSAKEYLLLTGFRLNDYEMLKDKISDSKICCLCGNSIVVNVLEAIFYKLFINRQSEINRIF